MIRDVTIPKLGMSALEADVVEIHVCVGQTIKPGDPVAELESDKVTFILESEVAGTVTAIHVQAGNTYGVGTALCSVESSLGELLPD